MRGLLSEYKACCFFALMGFKPLHHRHKVAGVEVDWITEKSGKYFLWEVKTVRQLGDFSLRGFHSSQLRRLSVALSCWSSVKKRPTGLMLMEVDYGFGHQALPVEFAPDAFGRSLVDTGPTR